MQYIKSIGGTDHYWFDKFPFRRSAAPEDQFVAGSDGSAEFFNNFYMHIQHHQSWELIHGFIMAGPILVALGMGVLWTKSQWLDGDARTAMTLAAATWAVVFVFDGFVAPYIVRVGDGGIGTHVAGGESTGGD